MAAPLLLCALTHAWVASCPTGSSARLAGHCQYARGGVTGLLPPQIRAHRRAVEMTVALAEEDTGKPAEARLPYVLTGLPRSTYRGTAMGWLHKTRLWYLVAVLYVVIAAILGRTAAVPLSNVQLGFRVLAAMATAANVFISDRYHNADRRLHAGRAQAYSAAAETSALAFDYLGISSVLTTQLWLWSANMNWMLMLKQVGVLSGLSTALVAVLARFVVPKKMGHVMVKATMATQFTVFLGYLAWCVLSAAPTACRVGVLIFFIYAPGLFVYALKWPKHPVFGFHEWFHLSVLLGHTSSMVFDLRNIVVPCIHFCAGVN
ncbi:hypothetical protein AB1Y20_000321 [Prymnesium parvum]|uniref:Uncharacterized protein n=1 Tax=Prymnesium parvum TaxID=97485 RepID=A0AB34K5Z8_PRYPA